MRDRMRKLFAASAICLSVSLATGQQAAAAAMWQAGTARQGQAIEQPDGAKGSGKQPEGTKDVERQSDGVEDVGKQPEGVEAAGKQPNGMEAAGRQPNGMEAAGKTPDCKENVGEQPDKNNGEVTGKTPDGIENVGEQPDKNNGEVAGKTPDGVENVGEQPVKDNGEAAGKQPDDMENVGEQPDRDNGEAAGKQLDGMEAAGKQLDGMEAAGKQPDDMQGAGKQADSVKDTGDLADHAGNGTGGTARIRAKGTAALPAPEAVTPEKVAYNSVTLLWSAVEGAAGYQIEYAEGEGAYTVAGTVKADTTSYQCKGLSTGTQYQFRVCALDKDGKVGDYASATAQPYLKKTAFTNVSTPQMQKVSLEWKKVPGAMNYQLYRKGAQQESYELLAVTAEVSYIDEAVMAGESYSYRVCAIRDENGKTVSAKLSAEAKASLASAAMQFEGCEAVDYHSVKLTWHQDHSAVGYYIYRSVKENGTYRKIKTVTKNTILSYTDTKLVPGKKFYYKICSYSQGADKSTVAGELSQAVQAQTQADGPDLVAINTNIGNRSLSLEWKKTADAAGYRIYRSVYPDKGFAKVKDLGSGTFVGYEDRTVAPGGTYYYRIKAIYVNGAYKGLSMASASLEGNVAPSAPIGLKVSQTEFDKLQVSWNISIGASSYNLYRADAAGKEYQCIAQGLEENTYADSGLADGRAYSYRVSAVGAAGEGIKCLPVSYAVGGVSMNTRTLKLCVGATKPLKTVTYLEGDVEWDSANSDIATVDSEGNVTGVAYGTVNVTATVAGKKATAVVSVTPGTRNGIDVSRWQEDMDWCRVKDSGVDFAFLRISNHYLEDYTFETKYQDAFSVGMPMGVYCYSRATTVEEAQEEARIVLEILNGRKLDYPIALDMEDAVHKAKTMKKETLHQMLQAFKQVIEDAGYRFVLYSYLTFLNSNLDRTKLDGIDLWVARYRNVSLGTGYSGTGNVKYWQYNSGQYTGSNSQVDGITNEAGELVAVDVNVEL